MSIPELRNGDMVPPRGEREDPGPVHSGGQQPPTQRGNHNLSIERTASVVVVKLTCIDEYGAIELFEHLVASARKGRLNIEIKATTHQDR